MDEPSLLPTAAEPGSVLALLVRLATSAGRGGLQRWESAIDGVVRRLHELSNLPAFERIASLWLLRLDQLVEAQARGILTDAAVHDLNTIVGAIECAVENLAGTGGLAATDIAVGYRRTDAAALARAAGASFRTLAGRRGIHFTVDFPDEALVDVDPEKLETILLALLYNAFKHTPMRGSIRCTLRLGGPDDTLTLAVSDGSPRIAASESEALFAPGVHDRSAAFVVGGRAINLGTARDFARLHGGTLVLRATPRRRGCLFEAAFPARAPHGVAVALGERQPAASGLGEAVAAQAREELDTEARLGDDVARDDRPLALIVEDNPHTQRILALTLQPAYSVAAAFDGAEGVAKARALKPDIIITDVRMPHMDGEAMVHEIRSDADLAEVPILVLTASDDRAVMVRLLDAGVEDVLRKPFEIPEVRARVRALVAAKRARDTLNAIIGHQEDNLVALAEEVASRQRGLEEAMRALATERDSARRADRVKGNFLRMMSHELRTPVAALQLQLHLFEHSAAIAAAGNGTASGVARMRRSVRRLTLLIETMTEWARVESGRFEMELSSIDLAALLRDTVDDARASADSKGIALALVQAPLAPLHSDARVVALLLQNLLLYALQTNAPGTVDISSQATGDALQVRLRCSAAAGLDDSVSDEVFTAFLDDSDISVRSGAGSGLGLRVVRDIARALGGDLELVSFDDRSSNVFVMTFRSATTSDRGRIDPLTAGGRHVDPVNPGRGAVS